MRSRVLALAVTTIVAVGAVSCSKKSSTPTNPTPPGGGGTGTTVTVNIPLGDGYGATSFAPANINVPVGGSVTWTNRDNVLHTSTSTTNIWASDIAAGSSFTRTFSTRGTFPYRCTVHPGMTGEVNVQ